MNFRACVCVCVCVCVCEVGFHVHLKCVCLVASVWICRALWRNGSASDSRSEGCVFKSRQGHFFFQKISPTPT